MNISNLLKVAWDAILRNKTRTLLTILGVVIGIASVIAMVSIGQSSSQSITEQVSSMGTNMIMVMRANQRRGGVSMGSDNSQSLTISDAERIKNEAKFISYVSPSVSASGQIVNGNNNALGSLQGGSVDLLKIRKFELAAGTNFTDDDVNKYSKVCVIGQTVVKNIFPEDSANVINVVGKDIKFKGIPLKIIGVLESKGSNSMGQDQDDIMIAPYTTVQKRFLGNDYLQMIYCSASSEEVADQAVAEVALLLRENHKLLDYQDDDFEVRTQAEMLSMMNSMTGTLTTLLAAIASISLIVGGIGIMNIMYVTVTERTKEIGLRMAIGARGKDILMQFLIESAILSLIGGIIGIILGLILSYVGTSLMNMPFVVSYTAIAVSFVVCAATGVFFGWYPAKKAANMDPITALRYE
ncbi:MAG: ABC transporter permease [Paludibacteraceae bacterium]|nr:ABC transporter permease [Paludibacteraceae bacterium]MBR6043302.1 ABC transporter permease [Paludibacteraceae bacterium]MCR5568016.1 ABC transporter permease [Paludibacteraceae bacterium]